MARYIKLFGLPGSGKSPVCRSFKSFSDTEDLQIRSSPARGNFGLHVTRPWRSSPEGKTGLTLRERLRDKLFDGNLVAAQVLFPRIFAHVFMALSCISDPKIARQLLNYWKIRVL